LLIPLSLPFSAAQQQYPTILVLAYSSFSPGFHPPHPRPVHRSTSASPRFQQKNNKKELATPQDRPVLLQPILSSPPTKNLPPQIPSLCGRIFLPVHVNVQVGKSSRKREEIVGAAFPPKMSFLHIRKVANSTPLQLDGNLQVVKERKFKAFQEKTVF
jgi:hypothetical protein